jgi:hypothetical protein
VDEIDSLFFNDKPEIKEGMLLSGILLLNKYRVIGMTATFRGDQGLNKMKSFLKDSCIITAGDSAIERKLELEIYGKLKINEINDKIIEIAKVKQQDLPVIIILSTIAKCEEME